ncbi:uncharacterized protein LOC127283184 [Leptopilina boulardi]|uniref:uncharacterized protein LOC127283184 n=1 Tax=Leptopilina boulardi TaxID=63433 RepID=UPI0021F53438|nr:uncharacterized protein LOC127283184 [Leptopilina boulardi]
MTLQSTLDLVDYFLNTRKVEMVFTGRINQDSLERFFGTVRLAGGTNDHPGTPTFLQIYKILSFYSILKPPKTGNCSLPETSNKPLMKMSELKEIFKNNNNRTRQDFIKEIKEKLNIVIQKEDSDFSDFVNTTDHDYDLPYVVDCLMYFVAGNVAKKFWDFHKCELCRSEFIFSNENNNSAILNNSISQLLQFEENYEITHPNLRLFKFLSAIEESFLKNCKENNVYYSIIDEISGKEFEFPCVEHAENILAYTLHLYLELRMRKFAHTQLCNQKQLSAQQKKLSKLQST